MPEPIYELRLSVRDASGASRPLLTLEAPLEFPDDELALLTRWASSLVACACRRKEARYSKIFASEAGGSRILAEMRL